MEFLDVVIRYGLAVLVGIAVGRIFSAGKVKFKGRELTVPYIERNAANFTMVVVFMLVCSLAAVGTTALQANRQEKCNTEFTQALKIRSAISLENEKLATSDRKALAKLFVDLLSTPGELNPSDQDTRARTLIESYNQQITNNDAQRATNDQDRKNNPLPEPKCGA